MCLLARVGQLSTLCLKALLITLLVYVEKDEMISIQHPLVRSCFFHKSYYINPRTR